MPTCTRAFPKAEICIHPATASEGGTIAVGVVWVPLDGELDRPHTFGWSLKDTPANRKLALRLTRGIFEGAVVKFTGIRKDCYETSYVDADYKVSGKHMNADLNRLGY